MHSVFLITRSLRRSRHGNHQCRATADEELEPQLRERVEDVLLNRRDHERAAGRVRENVKAKGKSPIADKAWRKEPVEERLKDGVG